MSWGFAVIYNAEKITNRGGSYMPKFDDFDLNLKEANDNQVEPMVGSRDLCTPGSCWKWVCVTTTV